MHDQDMNSFHVTASLRIRATSGIGYQAQAQTNIFEACWSEPSKGVLSGRRGARYNHGLDSTVSEA